MSKMMTQSEMAARLASLLKEAIPKILEEAGLAPLEAYESNGLPADADVRQLCIAPASGEISEEARKEEMYVQIQLPGEMRSDKYLSAIWPHLRFVVAPDKIGMMNLQIEHQLHYFGETMGESGATLIEILLIYEMPLDDTYMGGY